MPKFISPADEFEEDVRKERVEMKRREEEAYKEACKQARKEKGGKGKKKNKAKTKEDEEEEALIDMLIKEHDEQKAKTDQMYELRKNDPRRNWSEWDRHCFGPYRSFYSNFLSDEIGFLNISCGVIKDP